MQTIANVGAEVWLEHILKQNILRHFNSTHWHQIDSLDGLVSCHTLEKSNNCAGGNLTELVRCSGCYIELDIADLEVLILFQDSQSHLEEWHQESIEQDLVLNLV